MAVDTIDERESNGVAVPGDRGVRPSLGVDASPAGHADDPSRMAKARQRLAPVSAAVREHPRLTTLAVVALTLGVAGAIYFALRQPDRMWPLRR